MSSEGALVVEWLSDLAWADEHCVHRCGYLPVNFLLSGNIMQNTPYFSK